MKINNYLNIIRNWIEITGETNAEIYEVWKFLSEEGKVNLKKSKSNWSVDNWITYLHIFIKLLKLINKLFICIIWLSDGIDYYFFGYW